MQKRSFAFTAFAMILLAAASFAARGGQGQGHSDALGLSERDEVLLSEVERYVFERRFARPAVVEEVRWKEPPRRDAERELRAQREELEDQVEKLEEERKRWAKEQKSREEALGGRERDIARREADVSAKVEAVRRDRSALEQERETRDLARRVGDRAIDERERALRAEEEKLRLEREELARVRAEHDTVVGRRSREWTEQAQALSVKEQDILRSSARVLEQMDRLEREKEDLARRRAAWEQDFASQSKRLDEARARLEADRGRLEDERDRLRAERTVFARHGRRLDGFQRSLAARERTLLWRVGAFENKKQGWEHEARWITDGLELRKKSLDETRNELERQRLALDERAGALAVERERWARDRATHLRALARKERAVARMEAGLQEGLDRVFAQQVSEAMRQKGWAQEMARSADELSHYLDRMDAARGALARRRTRVQRWLEQGGQVHEEADAAAWQEEPLPMGARVGTGGQWVPEDRGAVRQSGFLPVEEPKGPPRLLLGFLKKPSAAEARPEERRQAEALADLTRKVERDREELERLRRELARDREGWARERDTRTRSLEEKEKGLKQQEARLKGRAGLIAVEERELLDRQTSLAASTFRKVMDLGERSGEPLQTRSFLNARWPGAPAPDLDLPAYEPSVPEVPSRGLEEGNREKVDEALGQFIKKRRETLSAEPLPQGRST